MPGRFRSLLAILVVTAVAACTGSESPPASAQAPGGEPSPVASLSGPMCGFPQPGCTELTVGLGYIPSVQFAPFYYAQSQGYYRDGGLIVTFQNKIDPDLVTLVGQGSIDIGVADGTSVIPAVSQGIPIQYVATVYGTFPNVVLAKTGSGITTAADLKGRKIGTPGKYGSSWIMLQALLGSAGLTPDDTTIVEYPDFGQGVALQQGAVDAATGFTNNEPVQLQLAGVSTVQLHVDSVVALPGPGLIASTKALASNGNAIRAFIDATLRAMREIAADPQSGVTASAAISPDLGSNPATQLAILQATIATWSNSGTATNGYGWIDTAGWQASIDYMTTLGLVPKPVTVDQLVTTAYLPAGALASPAASSAASP
ncbi:MAG TPA: ABC transporter substrate-binding protein [Candidatus Limnocylindrales bacterium]|nr:ABC transporter substrate-binding protein [Candidatus Limnocylindrales bacterium]